MKNFIIIAVSVLSANAFSQKKTENSQTISEQDTIISVVNIIKFKGAKKPAYFINGELVNQSVSKFLDPNKIESINVEKEDIVIENTKYSGKITIETKNNYKPNLISLNELRKRYTTLEESSVIFQIDNEIADGDYNKYVIDKNYILKITINKLENPNLTVIKVISKSEENIKKSNEIIIRGDTH
ncbi:hypothetical protein [Flavobacterium aquicola]|uniref:Uncharacterized protein n=1 Tax=Flavobacterium aquicola TaxID=1682742 RepID=A0A3E0EGB4_9FLAO|nr:hypothetical protein [Flavobacterium aquicola]REG96319.1 hypothetical protein C8P67_110146 [Flavobacterium aquicola]